MTPLEILIEGRRIMLEDKRWTPTVNPLRADGSRVPTYLYREPDVVFLPAGLAPFLAVPRNHGRKATLDEIATHDNAYAAQRALAWLVYEKGFPNFLAFEEAEGRTFEEVIAVFDDAIARASQP